MIKIAGLALVAALFCVPSASAQEGCNIKTLMQRKDIVKAMNDVYGESATTAYEYGFSVSPHSVVINTSNGQTWIKMPIYTSSIAYFHVHPNAGLNQPSSTDIETLKGLQKQIPGICSYVLGHDRISRTVYEIFPDGHVEMVAHF